VIRPYLENCPLSPESLESLSRLDARSPYELAALLQAIGKGIDAVVPKEEQDALKAFLNHCLSAEQKERLGKPLPRYRLGARMTPPPPS